MWALDWLGIPFNAADGTITFPWWIGAIAAALVVILFVLALVRTGLAGTLVFLAVVGFCGWAAWSWMEYDRLAERRLLEARAGALDAQALGASAALACVNGALGEAIEAACERNVFDSPEAIASALAFAQSRIALLSDSLRYAAQREPGFESTLDGLRASLEYDRYGVIAQALALRRNCTAERCDALRMFRDPERIRRNLREGTFDANVTKAAPGWSNRSTAGLNNSAETPNQPQGTRAPLPPNYVLPSAASIPPISIMTAEPPAAGPEPAGQPAQQSAPPAPPRRPAQQQQQQPRPRAAQQRPPRAQTNPPSDAPVGLPPPPSRVQ